MNDDSIIDVDNPLFDGLVGGSFDTMTLLRTIQKVKRERDEARVLARRYLRNTRPFLENDKKAEYEEWPWLEGED